MAASINPVCCQSLENTQKLQESLRTLWHPDLMRTNYFSKKKKKFKKKIIVTSFSKLLLENTSQIEQKKLEEASSFAKSKASKASFAKSKASNGFCF